MSRLSRVTSEPYLHVDSWSAAESLAVEWMREHGYPDAHATPGGADGGIDVRAQGALAQVKFRGAVTGRPVLHSLVGARGRGVEQLLCFSGTGFSEPAIAYANELDLALFTFNPAGVVTPVNAQARALAAPPPSPGPEDEKPPTDGARIPGADASDLLLPVARYFFGFVLAVGTFVFITKWIQTGRMNGTAFTVLVFMAGGAVALLWPAFRGIYRGISWLAGRRRPSGFSDH
jgi:hypothetical protein